MFVDFDTETVVENAAPHNLADNQQYNSGTDYLVERGVVKYPNGWYRLYMIVDTNSGVIAGNGYGVGLAQDPLTSKSANTSDDGPYDGTEAIYVWGLNRCYAGDVDSSNVPLETHLSSYIKNSTVAASEVTRTPDTFTSTATEVLDRANGTKPAFFTTEGLTLRADCSYNNETKLATATDGTEPSSHVYNRIFEFQLNSVSQFKAFANNFVNYATPRVPIVAVFGGNLYAQQVHEVDDDMHLVFRYQQNNSNLRLTNTSNNSADTNVTVVKTDSLYIGTDRIAGNEMNGTINRFTIWKIPFDEAASHPSSSHHKMVKLAR